MKRRALLSVPVIWLILASQTVAQTATDAISIVHPWARATPAGARTGAAYLTITNRGATADRLTGVFTSAASSVQVHQETEANGVMRMREVTSITVEPGATIALKPGGMHIMMIGLQQPLKEGQDFPLTLEFEKAGKIKLRVPVMRVGAMGSSDGANK